MEKLSASTTALFFYTIGERIAGEYVVGKDMRKNILFVSRKNQDGAFAQARREVEIADCNWVSRTPHNGERLAACLRYRAPLASCKIMQHRVLHKKARIVFNTPQLAAPGQSLVLYNGSVCLGGGVILLSKYDQPNFHRENRRYATAV